MTKTRENFEINALWRFEAKIFFQPEYEQKPYLKPNIDHLWPLMQKK